MSMVDYGSILFSEKRSICFSRSTTKILSLTTILIMEWNCHPVTVALTVCRGTNTLLPLTLWNANATLIFNIKNILVCFCLCRLLCFFNLCRTYFLRYLRCFVIFEGVSFVLFYAFHCVLAVRSVADARAKLQNGVDGNANAKMCTLGKDFAIQVRVKCLRPLFRVCDRVTWGEVVWLARRSSNWYAHQPPWVTVCEEFDFNVNPCDLYAWHAANRILLFVQAKGGHRNSPSRTPYSVEKSIAGTPADVIEPLSR